LLKADSARERGVGIALLSLATVCFAVLDTTAKWLVQDLPVMQVVWLRFATHVLLMVALLAPRHGRRLLRMHSPRLQLLRGVMLFRSRR
jgi:drug/metabolite transporter (DMT)-like permease